MCHKNRIIIINEYNYRYDIHHVDRKEYNLRENLFLTEVGHGEERAESEGQVAEDGDGQSKVCVDVQSFTCPEWFQNPLWCLGSVGFLPGLNVLLKFLKRAETV